MDYSFWQILRILRRFKSFVGTQSVEAFIYDFRRLRQPVAYFIALNSSRRSQNAAFCFEFHSFYHLQ